jgi:hypothetical protein
MMHLDTMTGKSIYIRQCSLHAAAPELLEALKLMLQLDDGWHAVMPAEREATRQRVYAAIGKARA